MTNEPSDAHLRRVFEEWYEADAMPMESDWFRRDPSDPDEYDQAMTAVAYRAYCAAFAAGAASVPRVTDLEEYAWTIIANAGGGNWSLETQDWQDAAARWRTQYHAKLDAATGVTK